MVEKTLGVAIVQGSAIRSWASWAIGCDVTVELALSCYLTCLVFMTVATAFLGSQSFLNLLNKAEKIY